MKQNEGIFRITRLIALLLLGAAALTLALGIVGYLLFMRSVDLPEARAIAERELRVGTLRFGESVERAAHVYIRRPSDYFRAANGIIAATGERVIFIGIAPRARLETPDAPPVILQQEFVNDTLLDLEATRVYFGTSRGVVVTREGRQHEYAATGRNWPSLEDLASYVNQLHQQQRVAAARERRLREAVERIVAEPLYYTVRRGDAISSIADWFGVRVEDLQQWNQIEGTRIRIGEQLLVKPGTQPAEPAAPDAA